MQNGIPAQLARAAEAAKGFMPAPEGLALYDTAAHRRRRWRRAPGPRGRA